MVTSRLRAACALAVIALAGLALAPTAHADDTIRTQPYSETLGIPNLHKLGLTGKGVTIAILDGGIDTSSPELAGADITVHDTCPTTSHLTLPDSITHGTGVTSVIASPDFGVAPDAKILFYRVPGEAVETGTECPGTSAVINQAITDGADIISMSISGAVREETLYALVRAAVHKVPIVVAAGNDGVANQRNAFAGMNLTIGVGATDTNGVLASYSSFGEAVTVCAPGDIVERNVSNQQIGRTAGTSVSTPIVAGFLAIAKQKWPEATGNQLTRLLINTATLDGGEERNDTYGYGLISPDGLITTDPSNLEDTNPLTDKGPGDFHPTPAEYADYIDGLAAPGEMQNDPEYIYRGADPSILGPHPDTTRLGTSPRYHRK